MRKVLELKGYESLKALNAFNALVLGLKMLPSYSHIKYEDFFSAVDKLTEPEQERLIREAALLVELQRDEVEALVGFCTDSNGVPYTRANLKNLGPGELHEIIVAVCLELSKIKINFVTDLEKKN